MEELGPWDVLQPGAISEDVEVPFKHQGKVIGKAVVHPDGIVDITIFDGPDADLFKEFLSGDTFSGFGMKSIFAKPEEEI